MNGGRLESIGTLVYIPPLTPLACYRKKFSHCHLVMSVVRGQPHRDTPLSNPLMTPLEITMRWVRHPPPPGQETHSPIVHCALAAPGRVRLSLTEAVCQGRV